MRPNAFLKESTNSIINARWSRRIHAAILRGPSVCRRQRDSRASPRAPAKVMVCSRSALTPRRIARAHRRRSAQPSQARARDGGEGGRREIGRNERGGRGELATACTIVLVVKASAMASGIFYGVGDARGSATKQQGERKEGKGGRGTTTTGRPDFLRRAKVRGPPGNARSFPWPLVIQGVRGWERGFVCFHRAPTRCTFPRRRSEGARFRERKNMILERLAGTTAASDEETRRAASYARYSVELSLGTYYAPLFSFAAVRRKRYEN